MGRSDPGSVEVHALVTPATCGKGTDRDGGGSAVADRRAPTGSSRGSIVAPGGAAHHRRSTDGPGGVRRGTPDHAVHEGGKGRHTSSGGDWTWGQFRVSVEIRRRPHNSRARGRERRANYRSALGRLIGNVANVRGWSARRADQQCWLAANGCRCAGPDIRGLGPDGQATQLPSGV